MKAHTMKTHTHAAQITRIAVIGAQIVTNQNEANEAARFNLNWNGYNEGDMPLEVRVVKSDCGRLYDVAPCWGREAGRVSFYSLQRQFTTLADAEGYAEGWNEIAFENESNPGWIKLPVPVDYIRFEGCTQGRYPQSRIARISYSVDECGECVVTGCGSVVNVSNWHSHDALRGAVSALIEALKP